MPPGAELTTVETVHEEGSWLFTVEDVYGEREEVLLVPCEDGVEAWVNNCTHEAQRLDRGMGAMMRDGGIICPKHGSIFDGCSGDCDNGKAAGTTLVDVDVAVEDGQVYLTDDGRSFSHAGAADADDDMPGSSSHLGF
jgi:nitrite reductase/ring-hydroxylating ferredoxin subunit